MKIFQELRLILFLTFLIPDLKYLFLLLHFLKIYLCYHLHIFQLNHNQFQYRFQIEPSEI